MVRRDILQLCCFFTLISTFYPLTSNAQGLGGMGGMRAGRGKNNASNDPPLEPENPAPKVNPFADDATPVEGLESRTAALERFVFGHAETNPKMKVRVQRLEKRLVPYEKHSPSEQNLEKRVNHLWSTVEAGNRNSRFPGTGLYSNTPTGNAASSKSAAEPRDPGADLNR